MVTIDMGRCSDFSARLIRFQDDFHQKYQKKRSITEIFLYYVGGALVTIGTSALLHAEAAYKIFLALKELFAKGVAGSLQNYEWSKKACEASWKSLKSLFNKSCLPKLEQSVIAPSPKQPPIRKVLTQDKGAKAKNDEHSIAGDSINSAIIEKFPLFDFSDSESSRPATSRSPSNLSDDSLVNVQLELENAEQSTLEEVQSNLQTEAARAQKEFENINCPFFIGINKIKIRSSFAEKLGNHNIKGVHTYGENVQIFITGTLRDYPCVVMINPKSDFDSYTFLEENLMKKLNEQLSGLSLVEIWNALHKTLIDLHLEFVGLHPENDGCFVTIAAIINQNLWIASAGNSKTMICTPVRQTYGIAANASIFGYSQSPFDPKITRFDLDELPDNSYMIMMNNETFFTCGPNKLKNLTNDQELDMASIIAKTATRDDPENPMSCLSMSLNPCIAPDDLQSEQLQSDRGSLGSWEEVGDISKV